MRPRTKPLVLAYLAFIVALPLFKALVLFGFLLLLLSQFLGWCGNALKIRCVDILAVGMVQPARNCRRKTRVFVIGDRSIPVNIIIEHLAHIFQALRAGYPAFVYDNRVNPHSSRFRASP